MSHKSKKTVEALRDYLGKDARGIRLLDDVASEMTEIRKRGNADRDKADHSAAAAAASRDELGRAEAMIQQLRQDLSQAKALCGQREGELRESDRTIAELQSHISQLSPDIAESDLEPTEDNGRNQDEFPASLLRASELSAAFNSLRKDIAVCPVPVHKPSRFLTAYALEDVVSGYSPQDMMTLGRFVACTAMFNMPCIIVAGMTFRHIVGEVHEKDNKNRPLAKFIRWFRNSLKGDPIGDTLYVLPRTSRNGNPVDGGAGYVANQGGMTR